MNKGVTLIEILIYISLVFIVVVGMYALSEIDSNNEVVKWSQLIINPDGIYQVIKTLMDENGKRLLYKNGKLVEPLSKEYAEINQSFAITHDVDEAIYLIFKHKYSKNQIDSFEKVLKIISNKDFAFYSKLKEICKNALDIIKQNPTLDIPKELEKLIK
jgi:hypothetical protein